MGGERWWKAGLALDDEVMLLTERTRTARDTVRAEPRCRRRWRMADTGWIDLLRDDAGSGLKNLRLRIHTPPSVSTATSHRQTVRRVLQYRTVLQNRTALSSISPRRSSSGPEAAPPTIDPHDLHPDNHPPARYIQLPDTTARCTAADGGSTASGPWEFLVFIRGVTRTRSLSMSTVLTMGMLHTECGSMTVDYSSESSSGLPWSLSSMVLYTHSQTSPSPPTRPPSPTTDPDDACHARLPPHTALIYAGQYLRLM